MELKQYLLWAICVFAVGTAAEPPPGGDGPVEEVRVEGQRQVVYRNGRAITIDCTDPRMGWICSQLTAGTFQPWWWDYYSEDYGFLESGGYDERNTTESKGNCADLSNELIQVGGSMAAMYGLSKGVRGAYRWYKGDRNVTLSDLMNDHFDVGAAQPIIWTPPPPPGFRHQRGILVPQSQWSRSQVQPGSGRRGGKLDLVVNITGATGAVVFLTGQGISFSCDFTPSADE